MEGYNHMKIKNHLDTLMAQRNLTLEKLAELSGVSLIALEFLVSGKSYPTTRAARKIAKALNVDIVDIWPDLNSREYQTFRIHKTGPA
jgi:transcriptional regulator with XRE-family HTH domain